jgi:hypothetical protein
LAALILLLAAEALLGNTYLSQRRP